MTWVVVVGAGFSRAIDDGMPLTDELGDLVLERLRDNIADLPDRTFANGTFEAWLSRLAEPQPDLSDELNMRHQHWFAAVSRAVYEVVSECEESTGAVVPWWLQRLLSVSHVRQFTFITFNYDTLIERAVERMLLIDRAQGGRALAEHVVDHLPPTPPGLYQYPPPPAASFHLLKLHGSVNSFWVAGDRTGATITRLPFSTARNAASRSRYVPGRTPFVVPPSATKTAYYDNPITREIWRRAAAAMREAERVIIIGYSLPVTDMVTSGMFSDCLADRDVRVDIVNPSAREVVERIERLGIRKDSITVYEGGNAIERYVAEFFESNALGNTYDRVRQQDPSRHVAIGIAEGENRTCWINSVTRNADATELRVGPVNPRFSVTDATAAGRLSHVTVDQIVNSGDDISDLVVVYQSGERARIHDIVQAQPEGTRPDEWLLLIPTAFPARDS